MNRNEWENIVGTGEVEKIRDLLSQGVDPARDDNFGKIFEWFSHISAIRNASQKGHLEIVKLLLQDNRVDPSVEDNYGRCQIVIPLIFQRYEMCARRVTWRSLNYSYKTTELIPVQIITIVDVKLLFLSHFSDTICQ